jgi:hypothetical protein
MKKLKKPRYHYQKQIEVTDQTQATTDPYADTEAKIINSDEESSEENKSSEGSEEYNFEKDEEYDFKNDEEKFNDKEYEKNSPGYMNDLVKEMKGIIETECKSPRRKRWKNGEQCKSPKRKSWKIGTQENMSL